MRLSAYAWQCEWCDHRWLAKSEVAPRLCSKCRRPGWHKTLTTKEIVKDATFEQRVSDIAWKVVEQARADHAAKIAGKRTPITTEMPMVSGSTLTADKCGERYKQYETGIWYLCGMPKGHRFGHRNGIEDKDQMDD